jgi:hypothetical protein
MGWAEAQAECEKMGPDAGLVSWRWAARLALRLALLPGRAPGRCPAQLLYGAACITAGWPEQ